MYFVAAGIITVGVFLIAFGLATFVEWGVPDAETRKGIAIASTFVGILFGYFAYRLHEERDD